MSAAKGIPTQEEHQRAAQESIVTSRLSSKMKGEPGERSSRDDPAVKEATGELQGVQSSQQKQFMHSSWWKDPSKIRWFSWEHFQWILKYRGDTPVVEGKVPVWTYRQQALFIWPHVCVPMAAQYISMKYFDYNWPIGLAYAIYTVYLAVFSLSLLFWVHSMTNKLGFLDASKPRDVTPDLKVQELSLAILGTVASRPLIAMMIKYDEAELPALSPWIILEITWFLVVVDFFFYIYHRSCHEVDWLWRFHRTHHLTKHPTAVFTPFADHEQDFLEILLIPALAAISLNTSFHTWWISCCHLMFTEILGHSGIRMYAGAANPLQPLLRWLDMELVVEDHDLHHRAGWRKSANYGKQTRIFDKLFGTTRPRLETNHENVDW